MFSSSCRSSSFLHSGNKVVFYLWRICTLNKVKSSSAERIRIHFPSAHAERMRMLVCIMPPHSTFEVLALSVSLPQLLFVGGFLAGPCASSVVVACLIHPQVIWQGALYIMDLCQCLVNDQSFSVWAKRRGVDLFVVLVVYKRGWW